MVLPGSDGTTRKPGLTNYHVARDVFKGSSFVTTPDDSAILAEVPDNSEFDYKFPSEQHSKFVLSPCSH